MAVVTDVGSLSMRSAVLWRDSLYDCLELLVSQDEEHDRVCRESLDLQFALCSQVAPQAHRYSTSNQFS